ncbi:MAG: flagellar type III secretion system pore protein FliP [Pseudomonadota bacterium]
MSSTIQMIVVLSLASLAPAIVLTATCFTRFVVVFSFLRLGLGTHTVPPNQVVIGLALFMTVFVMSPVATTVHERALKPYLEGRMNERTALEEATPPIREFLLRRTSVEDLALFYDASGLARPSGPEEVPLRVAVPAFTLSELRTAFKMGLIVLLPFLVLDLVVATVLSSLGMIMLPPTIIAMPLKLLLFLAVDGWHLVVLSLLRGVS